MFFLFWLFHICFFIVFSGGVGGDAFKKAKKKELVGDLITIQKHVQF